MEQQNNTKPKKKFYQKWWFWLIVAVVVLSAIFGGNTDDENKSTPTEEPTIELTEEPTEEPLATFEVTDDMFVAAINLSLPEVNLSEMEYLGAEDDMHLYKVTDNTKFAIYVDGDYVYKTGIIGSIEESDIHFYLLGLIVGIVDPTYTTEDLQSIQTGLGFGTDTPDFEDAMIVVNGIEYKYGLGDENDNLFLISSRY